MNTRLVLLTTAAAGLTTAGLWIASRSGEETPSGDATVQKPAPGRAGNVPIPQLIAAATTQQEPRDPSSASKSEGPDGEDAPPPAAAPSPVDADQDLSLQAAKVEAAANRELQRLIPLLNLDATQQDAVFRALAANNPAWSPALQVSIPGEKTSPDTAALAAAEAGDATTAIMPLLDDSQQQALLEDYVAREEWWGEVLPILLANNEAPEITATETTDTPAATPALPPVETAPAVKAFEGDDVILDP